MVGGDEEEMNCELQWHSIYGHAIESMFVDILYGHLKPGGLRLETVNGIGVVLQLIFVTLFLIYAPKDKKVILINLSFS